MNNLRWGEGWQNKRTGVEESPSLLQEGCDVACELRRADGNEQLS